MNKKRHTKKSNKQCKKELNKVQEPLSEPGSSKQTIEKRKRTIRVPTRTFDSSSDEQNHDPYSDDGEYGSDEDYDPVSSASSKSTESQLNSVSDSTDSIEPDYEEDIDSNSCDSIFDTRKKRKLKLSRKLQNTPKMCKSNEGDNDSAKISLDSVTLRNNIGCNIESINLSALPDEDLALSMSPPNTASNASSLASPSVPTLDTGSKQHHELLHVPVLDTENNSLPHTPTRVSSQDHVDDESNLLPCESPSLLTPDPVVAENDSIPNAQLSVPLLKPVDVESNPSPHAPTTPASSQNPVDVVSNLLPYQSPSVPASDPVVAEITPLPQTSNSVPIRDPVNSTTPRESTVHRSRSNYLGTPEPIEAEWEQTLSDIPYFEFDSISAGVQFDLSPDTSVIDVFKKILPSHIIDYIVERTNAYGQALCSAKRPSTRNSRYYEYRDTDNEEMLKFIGLCLLMGQVNVPQKRKLFMYSDPLYYHPIFQYSMSCRQFEQLLRCIYVSELDAKGKHKIINFIETLTEHFRNCYKPNKELSLDESLLLFRGRLVFRQYIKSKKARYGIKFYELTSSDGYVLNMSMYAGKDDDDPRETGKKTEKIVMKLMKPYVLKGHWLFMDNYYNSTELSQKLLDLKTHTTGTLRSNRKGNPKDITTKKLNKGQHVWVRKNKVYVTKWLDRRPVLMVTTSNHPKLIQVSNRHGKLKIKPEEVAVYNDYMSGIDRADQMVSYYSSPRKSLRWYKKVFFHLIDLSVWNAFFLYKKYCKKNCDFLTFREELIRNLINISKTMRPEALVLSRHKFDNRTKERTGFVLPTIPEVTENQTHWPEKIPVREGSKKQTNYIKCKMCSKKKIRRETGLRCKGCPEKPALCAICFEEWHNQS